MRVKKGSRVFNLNSKRLVDAIRQNYQLKLTGSLEIIKAGNVNLHLIGKDKQGQKYVIRVYREDKRKESVDHELALITLLHNKNFPVPTVYKTKNNDLYINFDVYYISLFEFIEGEQPPYTPEVLYQIGQSLAVLHNLSKSIEFKRNKILQRRSDLYVGGKRNKDIYQLLSKNTEKLNKSCGRAVFEISQAILERILDLDFSDCKEGLIHDDAVHHNLIFTKDHKVYFLDWGDTGIAPFILDFALPIAYSCTINAWNLKEIQPQAASYEVKILPRLFKAYLKGYDSKRNLKELELDKLRNACIFRIFDFQAWRFWHIIYDKQAKTKHLLNDWEIYEYLERNFTKDVVTYLG